MTSSFPPRESLVSDIPAGDGKTANPFLQCMMVDSGLCDLSQGGDQTTQKLLTALLRRQLVGRPYSPPTKPEVSKKCFWQIFLKFRVKAVKWCKKGCWSYIWKIPCFLIHLLSKTISTMYCYFFFLFLTSLSVHQHLLFAWSKMGG